MRHLLLTRAVVWGHSGRDGSLARGCCTRETVVLQEALKNMYWQLDVDAAVDSTGTSSVRLVRFNSCVNTQSKK